MDDKQKAKEEARIAAGMQIPFVLSESQADLFRDAFNSGFDAGLAHAQQWVDVNERLPEIPEGRVGVKVWMTFQHTELDNAIEVLTGSYTETDATGFHWWFRTSPLETKGKVLAWKYCEKKPEPFTPKGEQQ